MCDSFEYMVFKVLMPGGMKMAVFWVVVACSPVKVYLSFTGNCCLHHQGGNHCR
jgi:hypothetical protein